MAAKNLQEVLDAARNTVELLRNSQIGAYIYPVVPAEFSNWRREQRAWRETAVLFDQSHHMDNCSCAAPDAIKLISDTAHQQRRELPGQHGQAVRAHAPPRATSSATASCSTSPRTSTSTSAARRRRTGCSSTARPAATTSRSSDDRRSPVAAVRPGRDARTYWRFQIQGPNAWQVIEKLNGGAVEQLKFFRMATMNIGGEQVRTLRHGMAGAPGLEIWGPYATTTKVRDAIVEAGARVRARARRLARLLRRTRSSPAGSPRRCPAIYTGERAARLPRVAPGATATRRPNALAGCFVSDEHRGLLPEPVGARLRLLREVRPRLHRPRRARGDRPGHAAQEGHARVERRGPRQASGRRSLTATGPATSSSTCRSRTTARRTSTPSSTPTARSSATRCSPATAPTSAAGCRWPPSTPTCPRAPS